MLATSAALLVAALAVGPAGQEPAQTPPAAQAQTPPVQQVEKPKPGQADPGQAKPEEGRQPQRPPRPSRREPTSAGQGTFEQGRQSRDGGPTRQDVSFTANIMAGYDDNLTAGLGSGSGTSPDAMVSGTTASVDATLAYFRGNSLRSFSLDTSGSLMGYPDNLDEPAPGGSVNAEVRAPMGRSLSLSLSQRAAYVPLFNVLSPGAGTGPLPPEVVQPSPTTGLFERNSWSSRSGVSLEGRWGRRDTTTIAYAYQVQEFTDDDYGDNTWQDVTAGYRRILTSQVKAGPDYRYRDGEYADSNDLVRPTTEHRIEGVAEFIGAPSRRRSYSVLVAAGAGYIASVNASATAFNAWLPIGRARLTFNVTPTWLIEGGYQRDLSLLQGVTDDVYTTDTASVRTSGMLGRRTSLQIGATYSNWVTPVASGVNDDMNVYGASAGFRFLLTKTLAASAGYYYYYHRYSNPAALPEGFPAEYDRQAVRVGVTMFFPLAGSSSSPLNRW